MINLEFKCPLCAAWIDLKSAKNGKPHGFCGGCGLQVFFRLPSAVRMLEIALQANSGLVRLKNESKGDSNG